MNHSFWKRRILPALTLALLCSALLLPQKALAAELPPPEDTGAPLAEAAAPGTPANQEKTFTVDGIEVYQPEGVDAPQNPDTIQVQQIPTADGGLLKTGWYTFDGEVNVSRIEINGGAYINIILKDNCSLTVDILNMQSSSRLTIWGQTGHSGRLTVDTELETGGNNYWFMNGGIMAIRNTDGFGQYTLKDGVVLTGTDTIKTFGMPGRVLRRDLTIEPGWQMNAGLPLTIPTGVTLTNRGKITAAVVTIEAGAALINQGSIRMNEPKLEGTLDNQAPAAEIVISGTRILQISPEIGASFNAGDINDKYRRLTATLTAEHKVFTAQDPIPRPVIGLEEMPRVYVSDGGGYWERDPREPMGPDDSSEFWYSGGFRYTESTWQGPGQTVTMKARGTLMAVGYDENGRQVSCSVQQVKTGQSYRTDLDARAVSGKLILVDKWGTPLWPAQSWYKQQ